MTDATAPNHNGGAFADTPEYRQRVLGGLQRRAALVGIAGLIVFLVVFAAYFSLAPADTSAGRAAAR